MGRGRAANLPLSGARMDVHSIRGECLAPFAARLPRRFEKRPYGRIVFLTLRGRNREADKHVGWHRMPLPLGMLTLIGLRDRLRAKNLYDTGHGGHELPEPATTAHLTARTIDGTFNDLDDPRMGSHRRRFGRNVPLEHTAAEPEPAILDAEPARDQPRAADARRASSRRRRSTCSPPRGSSSRSTTGSATARTTEAAVARSALDDDDPWPEQPMAIQRTPPRPARADPDGGRRRSCTGRHALVGRLADLRQRRRVRSDALRPDEDGKLRSTRTGLLPEDSRRTLDLTRPRRELSGSGSACCTRSSRCEHNAICDRLRAEYPTWTDEQLFDKARLVNAALIAKIHTVDWTPAILAHPTTCSRCARTGGASPASGSTSSSAGSAAARSFSGIPGSPTDHHGAPYSLTEEFVAVYRMHPLIPDDFEFRSLRTTRCSRSASSRT